MKFTYEHFDTQEEVRAHIQKCESRHMQQCSYSTFHDALTQVCFGCRKIRTTIFIAGLNPETMGSESHSNEGGKTA